MFSFLSNVAKAATAIVVTPVATAVDIVKLPATIVDPRRDPFENTNKRLQQAGRAVDAAVKPSKD